MTAGVGKARPPRSFPTGLAKYLRPEAQTQTVEKPRIGRKPRFLRPGCSIIRASLTVALMVSLPRSGSLCHLRWQVPTGHTLPFAPLDARNAHEKCCGIRLWGSAPNPGRREGKRVPCGHLGRRPKATRSVPEGSVSPVGCCAKRKATRRCEQIQGLRAASAQNADICERQGSANDGATDDPPAPRPLSTSCARPALPGGAFLCPFHSPRNVIHYTQPFSPA